MHLLWPYAPWLAVEGEQHGGAELPGEPRRPLIRRGRVVGHADHDDGVRSGGVDVLGGVVPAHRPDAAATGADDGGAKMGDRFSIRRASASAWATVGRSVESTQSTAGRENCRVA